MIDVVPPPDASPSDQPVEAARGTGLTPREPLWRHVLGDRLRDVRHDRGETLTDVADRAGVSPQYLSEVERGRKEPSSEMIAAIGSALDLTLVDLTLSVAERLVDHEDHRARTTCRATFALAA